MTRYLCSLLSMILAGSLLTACNEQATQPNPGTIFTSAAQTAVAYVTGTAAAWTPSPATWTPTPAFTATPVPDALVSDMGDTCYIIHEEIPGENSIPIIRMGHHSEDCLWTGDTVTILGQVNNCQFLNIRTSAGLEGWIFGPMVSSNIQFYKTCDEVQAIYQRPKNGAYALYGDSMLFDSVNVLDLKYFLQDTYYWCSVVPCLSPHMYLGVLRIFNYTEYDALVLLIPYHENTIPDFSQAMYVQADEAVDFPICDEDPLNRALRPWLDPGDMQPADVKCFAYSDTGQYRVFATTGMNWNDTSQRFDSSPLYWSISTVLRVSEPVATHHFTGNVRVIGGHSRLGDYYELDYAVVVIALENTVESFTNGKLYSLGPAAADSLPPVP